MARFEQETHSFVVRLWREHRDDLEKTAVWRGWIEHIPTKRRHYFQDKENLLKIVSDYLGKVPELPESLVKLNDE